MNIDTSVVQVYKCSLDKNQDLFMIDTPGFNDTYRSDTDILREVANWLGRSYSHAIQLTGIVYLHRILDPRLGGSALKNLRMFKKLCGEEGLSSVVFGTTMWSDGDMDLQLSREEQLATQPDYWSVMLAKGSRMFRQNRGAQSATEIVAYLLSRRRPMILKIQRQLVDENLTLEETSAGQEIQAESEEQRLAFEKELKGIRAELEDAVATQDQEAQEELQAYRKEVQTNLTKLEKDSLKLQADSEALQRQMAEEAKEDREAIYREMRKNDDAIHEQEKLLALSAQRHEHDLQLEERQFRINVLNAEKAALARKARPWYEKLFD